MLARLQVVQEFITETVTVPQVVLGANHVLTFPSRGPWQVVFVNALRTNGTSTLIDEITFLTDTGGQLFNIGIVPWLAAGLVENSLMTTTPQISETSFFVTNVGNFISNDFNCFNGWQWRYNSLIASPGGSTDITLGFVQNG